MKRGLIITAPSGSGKTTIVRHLLNTFPELAFSVSATTRARRVDEVDGRDYHFLTPEAFEQQVREDGFLEWEEVYPGKRYGTLRSELQKHWNDQKVVVFDVDVRGALRLQEALAPDALSVFVKPPSMEALQQRLTQRGSESTESLQQRVAKAREEMTFTRHFDVVLVNDRLEDAFRLAEVAVRQWLHRSS
jgi:guanylate kinase